MFLVTLILESYMMLRGLVYPVATPGIFLKVFLGGLALLQFFFSSDSLLQFFSF